MTTHEPRGPEKPAVAIVGPGPRSAGGISAVLDTLGTSTLLDGFTLLRVSTHRDGSAADKVKQAAHGYAQLARLLASGKADIVWIHVASNWSFRRKTLAVVLSALARRPYVLHVHGAMFDSYFEGANRYEQRVIREVLRRSACVIALTPTWEARLLTIEPRARVATVMNPVNIPREPRAVGRVPTVVSLGRLSQRKGSGALVSAFARVADAHPDAVLVLAGDGEIEQTKRDAHDLHVDDRVEIPGWLDHAAAMNLLDGASLFVLPSQDEGLPIALLEAMARAVPCIATRVGGVPDVIDDGVNGVFTPVDDPEALSQAISEFLTHPERAEALGARARESARAMFSVDSVAGSLADVFTKALAR